MLDSLRTTITITIAHSNNRRHLLCDKSWKKAGTVVGSLFSSSKYQAPEASYVVTRATHSITGAGLLYSPTALLVSPPGVISIPQEKITEND